MSTSPSSPSTNTKAAMKLMDQFAKRTGLLSSSSSPNRRYLWTDGFAVCNFLGLAHSSSLEEEKKRHYEKLAYHLVDSVHQTLGKYRPDDPNPTRRNQWISGLSDDEGTKHPTIGGLRIGKELPERSPNEPYNDRAEWDRDGQYFHYLTKWIFALDQLSRYSHRATYHDWAKELSIKATENFIYSSVVFGDRMYWKMSIDLTRPQVPSMGAQDPLDGYVTLSRLCETARRLGVASDDDETVAKKSISKYEGMMKISATSDTLGVGGMMVDAYRVHEMNRSGGLNNFHLVEELLKVSLQGLRYIIQSGELKESANYRLAFRELGLSIGLHALEQMDEGGDDVEGKKIRQYLDLFDAYSDVAKEIESFWCKPENQKAKTWTGHLDINEVMLATSLEPDGFLRNDWRV